MSDAQQPPPPFSPGPAAPAYVSQPPTHPRAVTSLVLGILSLVLCGFFTGIPAIILGKQAQNEIDRAGGVQAGRGMATAGFVLGIIACVWGILSIILYATGVLSFNTSTS